ncbi:MAG TPA: hypothetical protein VGY53_13055, partial [Isosphaeraceae bacterium]|nr:hypothetical protein [Isosphaeraceae bacterium]
DVMVAHYKFGELDVKLHAFETATAHFRAGIAVLDGMIAKGLNAETVAQEKAILEGRVQSSRAALATEDWDALLKTDPKLLPDLLGLRATKLAQQGRLAEVAQAGAKLRDLEPKTNVNLYNAACAYSLCAALLAKDKHALTKPEQAEREKYVSLALDCLREAIAAGFNNFNHMRQDSDLAPLRGLPEFENLFPKASPAASPM